MKKFAVGVSAVLAIALVAVIAAPFVVPVELYKDRLAEQMSRATGRKLQIHGAVRLSILPRLEIEADNVTLANRSGAAEPDMLRLARLQLQLKLRPLLSGDVEIDRFVLIEPDLRLEIDEQGRPNWNIFESAATGSARIQPEAAGWFRPGEIRLGDVRLLNGRVSFVNRASAWREEISGLNLRVAAPSLAEPAVAEGEALWHGATVQLALRAGDPRALIEGRASPLAATLASEGLRTDFTGRAGTAPLTLDGSLSIAVPSITRLSHWLGTPIDLAGPAAFAMSGTILARGNKATLTAERVALDDASGRGELSVDASGAKPSVRAVLELGALDLTPYVPPRAEPVELAPPAEPATWSTEPIDIAFLRAVNADLQLTVSNLRVRDVRIGRTQLSAQLRDGRMVAEIAETTLYRGRGRGRAVLDASGAVPAVEANLKFAGLHAASLLTDIAGTDRFAGIGALDLSLAGRGRSPRELVTNLGGEGEFRIYDGAIKGVDLVALARKSGRAFSDEKISDARQTDFAELTGTLSIKSGIVRNFDLMLKSPLLRVEGTGAIDLPQRRLKYRLLPKSIVSLDGTAADGTLVPVVVEGPWDDLAYRPDPTALPPVDADKLPAQRGSAPSPRTLQQPGPAPAAGGPPRPLELRRGTVR